MVLNKLTVVSKSRKILLPGVQAKDLKPVAGLLHPSNLLVPLLAVSLLSQLSDNVKDTLKSRDIQKLPSIKFYSKLIYFGLNSCSLSTIFALSKTLGPELETLSILNVSERLNFLRLLHKKIIFSQLPPKISSNIRNLYNPTELIKHRKGLAVQFKSTLVGNSLFSRHSIVLGISLPCLSLSCIIESAKIFWLSLGLQVEEFDFMVKKQSFNILKKYPKLNNYFTIENECDCLRIIAFSEFNNIMKFDEFLTFDEDIIIARGEQNLIPLERELGFIKRSVFDMPAEIFILENDLSDVIMRAACDQRKKHKSQFDTILRNANSLNVADKKKKHSIVNNFKFKNLLNYE